MTHLQLASEGAYVPTPHEPTYDDDGTLPAVWTPSHVSLRLIEAFRIDKRLPRVASPKAPGSAHPQIEYTDEERAEWETIPYDPSRAYPSPAEIATMEECFGWLSALAVLDLNACLALRMWALRMAGGNTNRSGVRSLAGTARSLGIAKSTMTERKDRAISLIGSMLCYECAAVF
jgi:hypothetical protein